MSLREWTKDSFIVGLLSGTISLYVFYIIVSRLRLFIVTGMNDPYLFDSPRSELIAVALNLICFRFLLLKYERERMAKGILLVTVMATFIYVYCFYKK
jgi:hypothetical protein